MITFFTIIIVMNLIAWIYAKKELKKVDGNLEEYQNALKKVFEDRYDFVKRIKETYKKTDNLREETSGKDEA